MIEDKLDIIIALLEEISDRLYKQPVNTRVDNNKFITKEDMLSKDDTK